MRDYAPTMQLGSKRVLITGASRGIGEALADKFADAGATVALVARARTLSKAWPNASAAQRMPPIFPDPAQVVDLIGRVEEEAGPVDVLVNNAGIGVACGFTDAADDVLRMTTEVNYLAPAELCRQVIPRMLRRGGGHIVNVSSLAGIGVYPGLVTYSASKAALSHFTAGLRADYRGLPIGTTLVELGPVPTDILAEAYDYGPTAKSFERFYRTRASAAVPREKVAADIVEAVRKGKRHVRHPKRTSTSAMLVEAPRRFTELLLTGVPHR